MEAERLGGRNQGLIREDENMDHRRSRGWKLWSRQRVSLSGKRSVEYHGISAADSGPGTQTPQTESAAGLSIRVGQKWFSLHVPSEGSASSPSRFSGPLPLVWMLLLDHCEHHVFGELQTTCLCMSCTKWGFFPFHSQEEEGKKKKYQRDFFSFFLFFRFDRTVTYYAKYIFKKCTVLSSWFP